MDYVVLTRFEDWAEPVDNWSHLLPGEYVCFPATEVEELKSYAADAHGRGELGNASWLLSLQIADDTILDRKVSATTLNPLMQPGTRWVSVEILPEFWENWDHLDMREKYATVQMTHVLQVPLEHVVKFVLYAKDEDVDMFSIPLDLNIRSIAGFFREFPRLVLGLPITEVDNLVWGYLLLPCWVTQVQFDVTHDRDFCIEVIESMVVPFRDYLAKLEPEEAGNQNGFFMWFDLWESSNLWESFPDEFLAVLTSVLYLPSPACQAAALHGLNHLDHPNRATVIDTWANSNAATPSLLEFAELCRTGAYM